jgi:tellurite resistance protein TerC
MAALDISALDWGAMVAVVLALFAIDLLVSGRRPHAIEFREALWWSIFYIAVAVAVGVVFGVLAGWEYGAEYFAATSSRRASRSTTSSSSS